MNIGKFGRIVDAHIEDARLVLLLGRNNTGKSYASTLMWAVRRLDFLNLETVRDHRPKWYKDAQQFLLNGSGKFEIEIGADKIDDLLNHVNSSLERVGSSYFSSVFAFDGFADARLEVAARQPYPSLRLTFTREQLTLSEASGPNLIRFNVSYELQNSDGKVITGADFPGYSEYMSSILSDFAFASTVSAALFDTTSRLGRYSMYIPSARTGLMIALQTLMSQVLLDLNSQPKTDERLTLPSTITNFLSILASPAIRSTNKSAQTQIASWLEENLLDGQIVMKTENRLPEYSYRPRSLDKDIPFYATSSMISELAPFLIVLKSSYSVADITFEEPEAHLHLAAQRIMARTIARLVNAGIRVTITTHSDTFVQQINNLLKISTSKNKEDYLARYDYSEQDLIQPDCIRAYEFVSDGSSTRVVPIQVKPEGLVVPTLTETLLSLALQTVDLNEGADEDI